MINNIIIIIIWSKQYNDFMKLLIVTALIEMYYSFWNVFCSPPVLWNALKLMWVSTKHMVSQLNGTAAEISAWLPATGIENQWFNSDAVVYYTLFTLALTKFKRYCISSTGCNCLDMLDLTHAARVTMANMLELFCTGSLLQAWDHAHVFTEAMHLKVPELFLRNASSIAGIPH